MPYYNVLFDCNYTVSDRQAISVEADTEEEAQEQATAMLKERMNVSHDKNYFHVRGGNIYYILSDGADCIMSHFDEDEVEVEEDYDD